MFEITSKQVDVDALRRGLMSADCGGYTAFEGWVRDHHKGRAVSGLHYEAYADLATAEGLRILAEAEAGLGETGSSPNVRTIPVLPPCVPSVTSMVPL